MKTFLFFIFLSCFPFISFGVEPSEVLVDPILEQRARDISKDLRCLVCQNESIDDSEAILAKDLRVLVRERLLAGDSNDQVLQFIVDRYGEFALLRPKSNGSNLILWFSGPVMFLIALIISFLFIKSNINSNRASFKSLTNDEKSELNKIVNEE